MHLHRMSSISSITPITHLDKESIRDMLLFDIPESAPESTRGNCRLDALQARKYLVAICVHVHVNSSVSV